MKKERQLLINPFTPGKVAAKPKDFFGREHELDDIGRRFETSSVAIQGIMGIGKTSLMAQTRQRMDTEASNGNALSILCSCTPETVTVDNLARMILEKLVVFDERSREVTWKIPKFTFYENKSREVFGYFKEGRHLSALIRTISDDFVEKLTSTNDFLIIAIDEAQKSPDGLAHLIRALLTETQANGADIVRFLLCGVNPYFEQMVRADGGIMRFIPSPLTLPPLSEGEADDLLGSKFREVFEYVEERGSRLDLHPDVVPRIFVLSGGRPDIIQLLGSHIIDNESDNPDGIIDEKDLLAALHRVCMVDRDGVYRQLLDDLDRSELLDPFFELLARMSSTFPTVIAAGQARNVLDPQILESLMAAKVIVFFQGAYFLNDELLKVRLQLEYADRPKTLREYAQHVAEMHEEAASRDHNAN